jgi:hypothetical protein
VAPKSVLVAAPKATVTAALPVLSRLTGKGLALLSTAVAGKATWTGESVSTPP